MRLQHTLALLAITGASSWGVNFPVLAQSSPADATASTLASNVVVSAADGREVTLGLGSEAGVQPGAIYSVTRNGQVRARLRVTEVGPKTSKATVFDADKDFFVAVGESAKFERVEPLAASPNSVPVPSTPVPSTPAQTIPVAPERVVEVPVVSTGSPVATASTQSTPATRSITLSSVNNAEVEINAGSNHGIRQGATLPILQNGNVVGLVRVQSVQPNSSAGVIVWRDETSTIDSGLSIGMVGGGTGPAVATADVIETVTASDAPAAPIKWETGLSNIVVPRADRTYQYLATLAANGLITRYPASLFRDDGRNFHRTEEDITFTRAQITDLILEAVTNAEARGGAPSSSEVALAALSREYSRELQQSGLTERVAAIAAQDGFQLGFSGEVRASVTGGDTNNVFTPFSERQGGRRTESGVDARLNLFGQLSNRFSFFSEIDAGTDYRDSTITARDALIGTPLDDRNIFVRRAVLSYDADNLLRGLKLEAGRDELWWGPGHFGTLALGDTAGPLNMIRYEFKRGSYVSQGMYSPLGTGPGGKKRALYGKNSYVRLGSQTRLGFTETVLAPNDQFDPILFAATASPLPLLVLDRVRDTQLGQREDTNSSFTAYLETSIARGLQAYGELLIDDMGVDAGNQARNRIGSLLGAHLFTPRDPAKAGVYLEYANLQGQTYVDLVGGDPDYDFYYRGRPLGYPVAPLPGTAINGGGAESLRFDAYWRVLPKLRLGIGAEFADLQSEQPNRIRQQAYRLRAHYDVARNFTITARAQRVETSQRAIAPAPGIPETSQNLLQLEVSRAF